MSLCRENPREIRNIVVGVPEFSIAPLIYPRPATGLQGKFSMRYCVAAAALRGELGLDDFTDRAVLDVVSTPMFPRDSMEVDDRIRSAPEPTSYVSVTYVDGTQAEILVDPAPGKPERWLNASTQRSKFDDCVVRGGGDPKVWWTAIRSLDHEGGPSAVRHLVSSAAAPRVAASNTGITHLSMGS